MTDTKQKDLWKANLLEFFHNYFIGISHLECSNERSTDSLQSKGLKNCPIVDNWDEIEEKLSKKGLCALYEVGKSYLVVDAKVGNDTDAGTYENIAITLPSGNIRKVKPKVEKLNQDKKVLVLHSGYNPKESKELWLKEEEFILFFNNQNRTPNLNGIEDYLEEMWEIKENIKWDRDKSKKKVFIFCESEPSESAQTDKIDASQKDYIFSIWDPSITNSIKDYEVYNPSKGTEERQQLHTDYEKLFSEIRRVFGIRHLTSKKEERQNNPEIELNEAQFIALERRKKRIREKCLKEAGEKGFCLGIHTLTYGTAPEQREEKIQELEEIKDLEASPEALPSKDLEQEPKEIKGEPN